jgi:Thioesterase-like superfamily
MDRKVDWTPADRGRRGANGSRVYAVGAMSGTESLFERTVSVCRTAGTSYDARVEPAWNGPLTPNGGVLGATMLRAAQAELGPDGPKPRSIAAQFLDAPAAGPVRIDVDVLRKGRRVAFADVRMWQTDRLCCQAAIVFSDPRASDLTRLTTPLPDAPAPDKVDLIEIAGLPGVPPLFAHLELRPVFGPGLFVGSEREALAGGWMALRNDPAPLDAARLVAFTDLWWPAMFSLVRAPAGIPTLQLTVHLRSAERPAQAPVLARFETRTVAEGHLEETSEIWSVDGMLLAHGVQLALAPRPNAH